MTEELRKIVGYSKEGEILIRSTNWFSKGE